MSTITQLVEHIDSTALTTQLLDSAAALEIKLRDTERHAQSLARYGRQAELRYERAQQWIERLRRSHRNDSHSKTTALFKQALADLAACRDLPIIGTDDLQVTVTRPVSVVLR